MQRRGQIHAALIHLVATCRIHFSNALSREVVQHEMTIYEDLTFTSVCGQNVMDYSGENPGQFELPGYLYKELMEYGVSGA